MQKTILIIEDDRNIAELITLYLEKEGFRVLHSADGAEGLDWALQIKPDLLILDRMLPKLEGLEILKEIRKNKNWPVLILSAQSDEIEKILGLELGADDYMSKPFSPKELLARVKAILRRSEAPKPVAETLRIHDLELDPAKMEVKQDGRPLTLSALEFKLLTVLVRQAGRVFTRDQLLNELHEADHDWAFDRSIDAHIKNLRKKLGDSPKKPKYIASVFGTGYKFLEA
jgi:DNA-binding response OmpR family regulator